MKCKHFTHLPTYLKITAQILSFANPFKINALLNSITMFKSILPISMFLALALTAKAQTIYLKMDENCMDRLEYSSGDSDNPYVSYSFNLGEKRFANFDVGMEAKRGEANLPGKLTQCSSLRVDEELVKKVNSGSVKLYVVRENDTHYHVSPVEKASLLVTSGGTMNYYGESAGFSINLTNLLSGVNLALPGSNSEFYLDGTITYQCLRGYIIQKKENSNSKSFKEYVFVPELGIVERSSVSKTGFVDEIVRDNQYRLATVDAMQFKNIVSEICDRTQSNYYDGAVTATTNKPAYNENLTPKAGQAIPKSYNNTDPCSPSSDPNLHVVQKGETLYAISRKYSVPVAQLQTWNNLADGNIISLCQKLWVRQPTQGTNAGSTTTPATTNTGKSGEVINADAGYWTKSTPEHQVRSGETVASLAKMYGYTEERFRKMNGLSATEIIRPGQRLRTSDCNCPTLETSTKDALLPYDEQSGTLTTKDGTAATQPAKPIDSKDVYYRPITVHLVKSSDTWFSIAKQYNTTVERILELNGMTKDDKLSADQRIYVQ
jgi:LysM repeat protein